MKISEAAKFESDLLKPYEDIPPQSRGIKLQTFRLRGGGASSVGGGGGRSGPPPPPPPHPANHERNVRKIPRLCVAIIFALFGRIIFKLGSVDGYSAKENCFHA